MFTTLEHCKKYLQKFGTLDAPIYCFKVNPALPIAEQEAIGLAPFFVSVRHPVTRINEGHSILVNLYSSRDDYEQINLGNVFRDFMVRQIHLSFCTVFDNLPRLEGQNLFNQLNEIYTQFDNKTLFVLNKKKNIFAMVLDIGASSHEIQRLEHSPNSMFDFLTITAYALNNGPIDNPDISQSTLPFVGSTVVLNVAQLKTEEWELLEARSHNRRNYDLFLAIVQAIGASPIEGKILARNLFYTSGNFRTDEKHEISWFNNYASSPQNIAHYLEYLTKYQQIRIPLDGLLYEKQEQISQDVQKLEDEDYEVAISQGGARIVVTIKPLVVDSVTGKRYKAPKVQVLKIGDLIQGFIPCVHSSELVTHLKTNPQSHRDLGRLLPVLPNASIDRIYTGGLPSSSYRLIVHYGASTNRMLEAIKTGKLYQFVKLTHAVLNLCNTSSPGRAFVLPLLSEAQRAPKTKKSKKKKDAENG